MTLNAMTRNSGGVATKIDPPDDRYLPGFRKGLTGVGPRLIETRVAFSLYGTAIPVSYGVRRLAGNILWAKELQESASIVNGITQYSYSGTFAVSFGTPGNEDATKRQLLRVWADGRLVVDNRANGKNIARAFQYRWYDGSETQDADPTIVADKGADSTPAYRGQMYLVIIGLPLRSFSDKIPAITVEVGDVTATSSFINAITATGENGNNTVVWANSSLKRAYTLNSNLSPTGLYVYDLNTMTFLRGVSVNSGGIPQGGNTVYGMDKNFLYAPWCHKIFGFPDPVALNKTLMVIDPDFGTVESYYESVRQTDYISGTQMLDSAGTTVIACASVYSGTDSIRFMGYTASGLLAGPTLASPGGSAECHFFGKPTTNDVTYYFRKSGDPDVLSRTVLSYNDLVNQDSPAIETDWLPYDGIATTTIAAGVYCPAFNAILVIYTSGEARLVDIDTGSNIWRITGLAEVPTFDGRFILQNGDQSGGYVSYVKSNMVFEINLLTGSVATFALGSSLIAENSATFNSVKPSVIGVGLSDGRLREIQYRYAAGETIAVTDLLTQIALKSGYSLSDIVVDPAADDIINGALLTEVTSLREIIEHVRTLFGYEIIESDGKLHIKNAASAFVAADFTVSDSDLLGNGNSDSFIDRISVDIEIPKAYSLTYIDPALGYQWATQSWRRPRSDSSHSASGMTDVKVPFVMNATLAKNLSARITYSPWQSQHSYAFSLPKKFYALEPGDTISATVNNKAYLIKAVSVTYNVDHTLSVQGQDFTSFEPFTLDAYSGLDYNPEVSNPSTGLMFYVDIPHLSNSDYAPPGLSRFYSVISPSILTATFSGVYGYFGTGDTQSFYSFTISGTINYSQTNFSDSTFPVGVLTRPFGVAPRGMRNAMDEVNTINFIPAAGDETLYTSITYAEMMTGGNLAAVGAPGRWEVIRFKDVVLELDGSYTLSNIVRGAHNTGHSSRDLIYRYGTQSGGGGGVAQIITESGFHSLSRSGDYVVLLDPTVRFAASQPIENTNKLASYGAGLSPPQSQNVILQRGIDKMPRAPADLRVTRDTNGFLTISFIPTSMYETVLVDDATTQGWTPSPDESEYFLIAISTNVGVSTGGMNDSSKSFSEPISTTRATFSASLANHALIRGSDISNVLVEQALSYALHSSVSGAFSRIPTYTAVVVQHASGDTGRVSYTFPVRLPETTISTPVLPPNILAGYKAGGATDTQLRSVAYDKVAVSVRNLSRNTFLLKPSDASLLVSPIPSNLTMGLANVEAVIIEDV